MARQNLLDSLNPDQAASVLMRLARADPAIAARADAIARDLLGSIDSEDIADTVCRDLSALRIEDVWDTSGRTRYGYIHPSDRADEMLDEVIDSYKEEMMAYLQRGMPEESRAYCAGILRGIREFQRRSASALKDETPDYCDSAFASVQEGWEEAVDDPGQVRLLAAYLEEEDLL